MLFSCLFILFVNYLKPTCTMIESNKVLPNSNDIFCLLFRFGDDVCLATDTVTLILTASNIPLYALKIIFTGDKKRFDEFEDVFENRKPDIVDIYVRIPTSFKKLNIEQQLHVLNFIPESSFDCDDENSVDNESTSESVKKNN